MKYKLINPIDSSMDAITQVLCNRGLNKNEIKHFLNSTDKDINSPLAFGEQKIQAAAKTLISHIKKNNRAFLLVDPDVDGFTSSAIMLNYLHDLFPFWTENNVDYFFHQGKEHGLGDKKQIQNIYQGEYNLVIIPDAGSNDTAQCKQLQDNGIDVIILDHHDKECENPYAIIINNQWSDYPNKFLSGAGVVFQFCRYLDSLMQTNYADKYIDLTALGNCGDMMSMTSIETKHIIQKGFKNITNPFIHHMADKNSYSLGDEVTPIGAAFYIVPFVNATVRSGTEDEKKLVFESMLQYKAFNKLPSTKRGHKPGDIEQLVSQAVRVATNVKTRQTKNLNSALETLKSKIEKDNLLEHKVLMFLLKKGEVDKNIAGLVANKFMSEYQRPVCMLIYDEKSDTYSGSCRGCALAGILDFKALCYETTLINWAIGHSNAFGMCISSSNINKFLQITDNLLKDMNEEPQYYVDYIYRGHDVNGQDILSIAGMKSLWGTGLEESLIAVEKLKVTPEMVTVYQKKTNTIKIQISNDVAAMIFNATDNDISKLKDNNTGFVEINLVGKCNINNWNGIENPQIFIEDYEIIDSNKFFF